MKTSAYQRMSVTEKRAVSTAVQRERPIACTSCDTQVMPVDLLSHHERCPGPREPEPRDKWVTHREVIAMGVPRATLSFWANNNKVRFTGERQDRKYLYRDLVVRVAQRNGFRRR